MLSDSTIRELQKIIRGDYGKEITFDVATEIANNLITYFDKVGEIWDRIKQDKNTINESESNNIKS